MVTQSEHEENLKKAARREAWLKREKKMLITDATQMLPFIRKASPLRGIKMLSQLIIAAYEMGKGAGEQIGKGEV